MSRVNNCPNRRAIDKLVLFTIFRNPESLGKKLQRFTGESGSSASLTNRWGLGVSDRIVYHTRSIKML
jgi:hypothetical protein